MFLASLHFKVMLSVRIQLKNEYTLLNKLPLTKIIILTDDEHNIISRNCPSRKQLMQSAAGIDEIKGDNSFIFIYIYIYDSLLYARAAAAIEFAGAYTL